MTRSCDFPAARFQVDVEVVSVGWRVRRHDHLMRIESSLSILPPRCRRHLSYVKPKNSNSVTCSVLSKKKKKKSRLVRSQLVSQFVSWCFEPSQPQRITLELEKNEKKTSVYLPVIHSTRQYTTSLFFSNHYSVISIISQGKPTKTITCIGAYLYSAGTQRGNLDRL